VCCRMGTMTSLGGYKVHPVADLFPLLEGEEFDALVESFREIGQQEPIWIRKGVLLDGRNRLRASMKVRRPCAVREWKGHEDNIVPFIIGANIHRRHLTAAQRREINQKLRTEGHSIRAISQLTKTPRSTVARDVSHVGQLTKPPTVTGLDNRTRTSKPKSKTDELLTGPPELSRIEKLLTQAKDPAATPAEAATYVHKASELVDAEKVRVFRANKPKPPANVPAPLAQPKPLTEAQESRRRYKIRQSDLEVWGAATFLETVEWAGWDDEDTYKRMLEARTALTRAIEHYRYLHVVKDAEAAS